ncbi:MAG TPA: phage tail protein [Caulobacteraceae bacterium]|jgi:hypothetical protein
MGAHAQPQQVPDYTGLNLQTSSMSLPVPLAWGKSRGSPNLIYYTDFTVHKHSQKGGKGGKVNVYDYTATIILAICEGPITSITQTWVNNGVIAGFSAKGFVLFTGTIPQAPWSYLTTNHPNDAFGYQGIAYVAAANYDLGESETIPQQSFEVEAPLYNTGYTGGGDADCALVAQDFLTNPEYGALFPAEWIDTDSLLSSGAATGAGDSAYQTYCRAMGWGISPFMQNQEIALDVLARWCQLTNTAPVWTGFSLKWVPFGDATVTANGVTYLPPTASVFSFGDAEVIQAGDADPDECAIADWFDASNAVALECRDRANSYNTVPIDWIGQSENELIGRRYASTVQAHEICETAMGFQVVSLIGQRMTNILETHQVKAGPEWSLLEPMDCGEFTEAALGLAAAPTRIRIMEEQDDGSFAFTLEEFPGTTGSPSGATTQGGIRAYNNALVDPGPVNDPIIFEPNSAAAAWLNKGSTTPLLVILASGGAAGVNNPGWGGYIVNASTDGGTTYGPIGTMEAPANQGVLTASLASYGGTNPDTGHTLAVDLTESAGVLVSASTATDAAAGVTLGIVQDGVCSTSYELIGPETATVTAGHAYALTNLYRGLFGTTAGSHSSGALYGRLDAAAFIFPLPPAYVGVALKIKLQSMNVFGNALEDLSTCTVYTYTPAGIGYGGGSGGVPTTPAAPTTSTINPEAVGLSWSANPATDNVSAYEVWRAAGSGASFGSASLVQTVTGLGWTDNGLTAGAAYTYFLKARNLVGASSPSAGANATAGSASGGGGGIVSAVKSASFTTDSAHNTYYLDTVGGAYTVTLNATPAADEVVEVWDSTGHAGANPISFDGNGNTIAGSATLASFIEINFGHARLIWDGTQWLLQ